MKNKKFLLTVVLLFVALTCVFVLSACDELGDEHVCESKCPECGKCTNTTCQEEVCKDKCQGHEHKEELPKYDLSGVTFADASVPFDGTPKTITATNVPQGVTATYEHYKDRVKLTSAPTDVGEYTVYVTFEGDEDHQAIPEEEKTLSAKLTITKANYDMTGVTFANKEVTYNGSAQTLVISGTLPTGVTVSYEYAQGETVLTSEPQNAGTYAVTAKFTVEDTDNYNTIPDMHATLTIAKANIQGIMLGSNTLADGETKLIDTDNQPFTMVFADLHNGTFEAYLGNTFTYAIELLSENPVGAHLGLSFYDKLVDSGNTVDPSATAEGKIEGVNDVVYVLVSDSNGNYNDLVVTVKGAQRVFEIATYAQLLDMVTDVKNYPQDVRLNTIYRLMDNIDCGGETWVTINTVVLSDANFVGEFDGNSKTISNFVIDENSVEEENINDENGIAFGFFGVLRDAYIHDLTFSSVEVSIFVSPLEDRGYGDVANSQGGLKNPIYFGILAGETRQEQKAIGTHFENIKIENSHMQFEAYHGEFGAFVGIEYAGQNVVDEGTMSRVVRKGLVSENVTMELFDYAARRVDMGGLVGAIMDGPYVYENCQVKGLVMRNGNEDLVLTTYTNNCGGFVGYYKGEVVTALGAVTTFKNCSITNFRLEQWSKVGDTDMRIYCGWVSAGASDRYIRYDGCSWSNGADEKYGFYQYSKDTGAWVAQKVDPAAWLHQPYPAGV